jgi:hypothetical protein
MSSWAAYLKVRGAGPRRGPVVVGACLIVAVGVVTISRVCSPWIGRRRLRLISGQTELLLEGRVAVGFGLLLGVAIVFPLLCWMCRTGVKCG